MRGCACRKRDSRAPVGYHSAHSSQLLYCGSFLLKLASYATSHGISLQNCGLRRAVCIGESLRTPAPQFELSALGKRIHAIWPELELFSTYASTEMQTSFTECEYHQGCHLPPQMCIVEFLDEHHNPVADGKPGEVTVTTLGVQGMPLLRFKTDDVCCHYSQPCQCCRNTIRLSCVLGRKAQMIKYKGTTLYPAALYNILDGLHDIKNYIIEVYTNELGTDSITVRVGASRNDPAFLKEIKDMFRSKVRVAPDIIFESPKTIREKQMPSLSRKPVIFNDKRS